MPAAPWGSICHHPRRRIWDPLPVWFRPHVRKEPDAAPQWKPQWQTSTTTHLLAMHQLQQVWHPPTPLHRGRRPWRRTSSNTNLYRAPWRRMQSRTKQPLSHSSGFPVHDMRGGQQAHHGPPVDRTCRQLPRKRAIPWALPPPRQALPRYHRGRRPPAHAPLPRRRPPQKDSPQGARAHRPDPRAPSWL